MTDQGKPGRRAELAEMALAIRDEGAMQREIAEILGISRAYVSALINDPTGESDRTRKDKYRRPCPRCGALMASWTRTRPKLCRACDMSERTKNAVWTREVVIEAIRTYATKYGRPPSSHEWNPALARKLGRPDLADRFYADACWPNYATVQRHFPRWNNAIAAAGFTPLRPGHKYVDRERVA